MFGDVSTPVPCAAGRIKPEKNPNDSTGNQTQIFRLLVQCLNQVRHRKLPKNNCNKTNPANFSEESNHCLTL